MKLLIAGGYGQLGSEFLNLCSDDYQCICLGSSDLDVTNAAQVQEQIDHHQPNAVINAAAYTAVDRAEEDRDRAYAINRDGVENLAVSCARADIPLLHVSTDYVFSGKQSQAYTESDDTDPQGIYGASKLAGEHVLRDTWAKHLIFRVSWVFGQHGNNFVKTMLRAGAQRDELNVVADQLGAPTAARSIAENIIAVTNQLSQNDTNFDWGTYHLPSTPFTSWHGFAEEIFARAVANGNLSKAPTVNAISTAEYPTTAARPANSQLVTEKPLSCVSPCDWRAELDTVLKALGPIRAD